MASPVIQEKSHIGADPAIRHGRPCILGTRVAVQDIVLMTEFGKSADDIVGSIPHLSYADVYAALAFYHDHREMIDQAIRDDEVFAEEFRKKNGPGLLDRLLNQGDASISS